SPNQQLLTGLPRRVKRSLYLRAAKRSIRKQAAVFPGKGNPLGHTLVNDVGADFRQAIYVSFPSAVVSSFYRIVKKAIYAIPIVLIVLRGIDTSLGCNGVSPSGTILKAEGFNPITHF